MAANRLKAAVELAKKTGHVFLATADADGIPHTAAAGQLEQADQDCLAVSEWFCPETVKNLQTNHAVSIVIWDTDADAGFQLIGHLKSVKNVGILDGYLPDFKQHHPLPQVEKQLLIHIEKILDFKLGPHSDTNTKEQDMPLFTERK